MPDAHQPTTEVGTLSLIGREDVRRRLDDLLTAARSGRGGSLVLRGEAGIGKSALLDYAESAAAGFQVIRVSGAEFEQELPYSALHQLCAPLLERLPELPARHRKALQVAFGLAGGTSDPFQIGLAALGLAVSAAQQRPLLCLVDDAQWLDSASSQAMLFLARRTGTDAVAVVFGARTPYPSGELDELDGVDVYGLSDAEAVLLLETRSPFPLDEQVRDRLVTEADGNPLALLELPRAGGYALPAASSVPTRIASGFERRLAGLSADARMLLTLASADPTGDTGLLWRAAHGLGLDIPAVSAEATTTELAEFGTRVRFCHPLARSAVYRAAPLDRRQAAHLALARATDVATAADRRAWHLAQAGTAPDDDIAAELERCASRARARGGVAAAAAFLERSAMLSLDGAGRVERTLAAAQAHLEAGTIETAARLLATVDPAVLDELQRVRYDSLSGRTAFDRDGGLAATRLMISAARRLATLDPARGRDGYVDALEMSLIVGHASGAVTEVLGAARAAAPATSSPDLLQGLLALAAKDYAEAVPILHDLLHDDGDPLWTTRPTLASTIAVELWDMETYADIAEALRRTGRDSGTPALLRLGLAQQSIHATTAGDVARAIAKIGEEEAVADAAGARPLYYHRLHLAAHRGRQEETVATIDAIARAHAGGRGLDTIVHCSSAVLYNGLGHHAAAMSAALRAVDDTDTFLVGIALPELVEAAVRSGQPATAERALRLLTDSTRASGTAYGLGIAAAARGLVTGVEEHFREAVERLSEVPMITHLGRAHLLYGEWLVGAGRQREALGRLRTAHELLVKAGADGFAQRASTGLLALGTRVTAVAPVLPLERLTMQEVAVARAVAGGATSSEVAHQLFISKRTVDAHLRSIFRKLDVKSRRQLRDYPDLLSPGDGDDAEQAV